ncbi:MAG TPA: hypothetical protein VKX16_01720 [Chloroflexota bacterium]|nr:hypothetical protein [Chloroflexota bacterium]
MTTERLKRLQSKAEEQAAEAMQRIHDSGEIRHLHGKPLPLDDDPEWLVSRILKAQGFSHPLLERARELDEPERAAADVLKRLARRRAWLSDARSHATDRDIAAFNDARTRGLADYRAKLGRLNAAIRDFNLAVPDSLQRRPVQVERAMEEAERAIPPLQLASRPPSRTRSWPFRRRRD